MHEIEVALTIAETFDALGVPYCVGGAFASIVYGEARATRDVDMLAALRPAHVPALVAALTPTFYLQPEDVHAAVTVAPTLRDTPQQRATVNMIHQASFFKADIFVSSGRPFDTSQFTRRVPLVMAPGRSLAIASAEDTVLAKLEWYRMGGEVSDRQWRDVLAVLAAQDGRLDDAYLRRWATTLGVRDLLDRAVGGGSPPEAGTQQRLF